MQLKAKRKTEEPCTVVLYAGFCEGIGGVIRHSISIVPHAGVASPIINKICIFDKNKIIMETIRIDILNPKAKSLLKGLADLNLIRIKREKLKSEFIELLDRLRISSKDAPSFDEITSEVEAVRKARYEK